MAKEPSQKCEPNKLLKVKVSAAIIFLTTEGNFVWYFWYSIEKMSDRYFVQFTFHMSQ